MMCVRGSISLPNPAVGLQFLGYQLSRPPCGHFRCNLRAPGVSGGCPGPLQVSELVPEGGIMAALSDTEGRR